MNDSRSDHAEAPPLPNSRKALDDLLDSMLQHPDQHEKITAQIKEQFEQEQAPLIIDMCGFTRTTHQHGIVAFLLMIHEMHRVCCPAIRENGGKLIKTEADNLFCLFDSVQAALAASLVIIERLETVNLLLPEDRHLYASIGIGWGRVLNIENHDLFGDEINLACKLSEDIATQNMVLLTERAHEQLPARSDMTQRGLSISGISLTYFELAR
ncbi:MAG TPA: adenylate/guanylate cyclase domain-containing protein [Xanthomonadaceae bacterium]|jgi:adenylate cyclase|nr:adenylate/guanylate cyclase domain-containing protein [Xanthomonadaceae bacterium]